MGGSSVYTWDYSAYSIFSLSVDYLVKDELEDPEYVKGMESTGFRRLSLETASEFIEANELYASKIALGVFLSISSAITLVFLDALGAGGYLSVNKELLSTLGIIVIFLLVSLAVGIFIRSASIISRYNYLKTEILDRDYGVDSVLRQRQEDYKASHSKKQAFGVSLLILSVIPVLISELLKQRSFFRNHRSTPILTSSGQRCICPCKDINLYGFLFYSIGGRRL